MSNLYKGVEYLRQYQGAKLVRAKTFEKIVKKLESCERAFIKLNIVIGFPSLKKYELHTCRNCLHYKECIDRFDILCEVVHSPKNKQVKNIIHW